MLSTLQIAMPHRFSSMYPTPEDIVSAIPVWAIGFIEAGLTKRQIDFGIKKTVAKAKHCPDAPAFIALCKPSAEDMGLPILVDAYTEACRNAHPATAERNWSHPAVYHTAKQVGSFELRSLEKEKTFPMFESAYQQTINAILNGEELPEIPKALDDHNNRPKPPGWKPTDEDKAKGRQAMADIMGMLGGKSQQGETA